jgi:manganese/zinc/iron transport system permease protein
LTTALHFYQYFNPYYDQTFIGFLWQLFLRIGKFLTGNLGSSSIAADEIQILTLCGVAGSAALVGTFLVLKRMTMLANSISHTILVGIIIAFMLTRSSFGGDGAYHEPINIEVMLLASLIMGVFTSLLTEFLSKTMRLQEDASTGLVFTTLFALGIILVTALTRNAHIGAEVVMGNVDALHIDDSKLVYLILAANALLFVLLYKEYKITTFDPNLAKALGYSVAFFNYLLMIQVSATVVGAFRAVGVIMVLAFITGPALAARFLTNDLKKMLYIAVALGCSASVIGVALSRHLLTVYHVALSTSGVVVTVIVFIFLLSLLFAPERGLLSKWRHRKKVKVHPTVSS